jgi:hypothetical protein
MFQNFFIVMYVPFSVLCMLFVCKYVLYFCHRVSTQLQIYIYIYIYIYIIYHTCCGPGQLRRYSDSVRAGRSGDRLPVGARFSAPVQTGLWAHLASYKLVFPGSKVAGEWRWPPTPSSAEVKARVELYLYSPCGPSWPVLG